MNHDITPHGFVLLSGLVQLPFSAVGQAHAATFLGCPTVQPLPITCAYMRSVHLVAPMARTRV